MLLAKTRLLYEAQIISMPRIGVIPPTVKLFKVLSRVNSSKQMTKTKTRGASFTQINSSMDMTQMEDIVLPQSTRVRPSRSKALLPY